ncbi:MoxR-like ATPase [Bifidobacterium callitrichos DSM 23973]|uniref:MoxR-like ATPase n=1 Tax=Bifidobacterium callitrichos DSM 23973 TaxID=1437609 RepID=A0A087A8Z6_9BIFI|nr:AAA family ATPase [Bifidobacterium callitrichos]KFI55246.1 MoxR-like ATPase [Bifidobacterium callitrichos DSM 23973]
MAIAPESAGIDEIARVPARIADELERALSCSREVVDLAVTTFAAGGHLLLEDVPGVGKTTLARALAQAVGGQVRRIQFTPDMLPSDLTGVNVWSQAENRFVFHHGPLFANVVIADEINRANPKTQSAMLEAMGEGSVSVDGVSYDLPDPYFVVATQNPIELEARIRCPKHSWTVSWRARASDTPVPRPSPTCSPRRTGRTRWAASSRSAARTSPSASVARRGASPSPSRSPTISSP